MWPQGRSAGVPFRWRLVERLVGSLVLKIVTRHYPLTYRENETNYPISIDHSHCSLAGSRPRHARSSSSLAAADRPFSLRSSAVSAVFRRSIAAMCAAPASPRPLAETSSAVSVRLTSSA